MDVVEIHQCGVVQKIPSRGVIISWVRGGQLCLKVRLLALRYLRRGIAWRIQSKAKVSACENGVEHGSRLGCSRKEQVHNNEVAITNRDCPRSRRDGLTVQVY